MKAVKQIERYSRPSVNVRGDVEHERRWNTERDKAVEKKNLRACPRPSCSVVQPWRWCVWVKMEKKVGNGDGVERREGPIDGDIRNEDE